MRKSVQIAMDIYKSIIITIIERQWRVMYLYVSLLPAVSQKLK